MIVTRSPKMQALIQLTKQASESLAPILLTGESGTGKELFAQLVHETSHRNGNPFVRVNSAALPQQLIESELFGHEKGSFTDAVSQRVGKFERASGGSLLLDEISEMPIGSQATLLRVLETGEFERVGGSDPIVHDVRIIASTNRCLNEAITEGRFRLDLYHRLNVIEIEIPALRERAEDVSLLANHFLERFRAESRIPIEGFTPRSLQTLEDYHWPGNVRELRNVVHRACVLTQHKLLDLADLPVMGNASSAGEISSKSASKEEAINSLAEIPAHWLNSHLADTERAIILAAVEQFGSQRVVAEKLGVSTRTLSNKIRQYRKDQLAPSAQVRNAA